MILSARARRLAELLERAEMAGSPEAWQAVHRAMVELQAKLRERGHFQHAVRNDDLPTKQLAASAPDTIPPAPVAGGRKQARVGHAGGTARRRA
jgi:hypothetical protein